MQNDNPVQAPPQPAPVQMNAPAPAAAVSPVLPPASLPEAPVEMKGRMCILCLKATLLMVDNDDNIGNN